MAMRCRNEHSFISIIISSIIWGSIFIKKTQLNKTLTSKWNVRIKKELKRNSDMCCQLIILRHLSVFIIHCGIFTRFIKCVKYSLVLNPRLYILIKMLLDRYFLERRLGCLPTEGCDVTTEKSQGRLFLMWNFGM